MNALAVALGGALGSLARWGLAEWVQARSSLSFPTGTLAVNALGCLLIGTLWGWLEATQTGGALRLFAVIGFLGAFTTFSTFSHETVLLVQQGHSARAAGYVLASVGIGVLLATFGLGLGSALARSLHA